MLTRPPWHFIGSLPSPPFGPPPAGFHGWHPKPHFLEPGGFLSPPKLAKAAIAVVIIASVAHASGGMSQFLIKVAHGALLGVIMLAAYFIIFHHDHGHGHRHIGGPPRPWLGAPFPWSRNHGHHGHHHHPHHHHPHGPTPFSPHGHPRPSKEFDSPTGNSDHGPEGEDGFAGPYPPGQFPEPTGPHHGIHSGRMPSWGCPPPGPPPGYPSGMPGHGPPPLWDFSACHAVHGPPPFWGFPPPCPWRMGHWNGDFEDYGMTFHHPHWHHHGPGGRRHHGAPRKPRHPAHRMPSFDGPPCPPFPVPPPPFGYDTDGVAFGGPPHPPRMSGWPKEAFAHWHGSDFWHPPSFQGSFPPFGPPPGGFGHPGGGGHGGVTPDFPASSDY